MEAQDCLRQASGLASHKAGDHSVSSRLLGSPFCSSAFETEGGWVSLLLKGPSDPWNEDKASLLFNAAGNTLDPHSLWGHGCV